MLTFVMLNDGRQFLGVIHACNVEEGWFSILHECDSQNCIASQFQLADCRVVATRMENGDTIDNLTRWEIGAAIYRIQSGQQPYPEGYEPYA